MSFVLGPKGLALIKSFEALRLTAYLDQAKIWTIGYGHIKGVVQGMVITEDQADALFVQDSMAKAHFVDEDLFGGAATTQNQFDAMASLTFNIGTGAFATSSVLRFHRAGNYAASAEAFLLWDKAHVDGQLVFDPGLDRRRRAERDLYLSPV